MTPFDIERLSFSAKAVSEWAPKDPRNINWPVVYVIDGKAKSDTRSMADVYVGESRNAGARMRQHLASAEKQSLRSIRVIIDETFNKSVCLDLESFLIRMLAGDGIYRVLNRNDGITDADYFDRSQYQETFRDVFEQLRSEGVFTRTIAEIENSDLFKLSPYKALTQDQAVAVEDILSGLFEDLGRELGSTIVIQGEPGTGKTVVAIYLLKLLVDIAGSAPAEDFDSDTMFAEFFAAGYRELLSGLRIGIVVPQQSLRKSIQRVFTKTPGLHKSMVLTPFQVGESAELFDLLIVDEAHRLNQRANQPSASQNKKFETINRNLFGSDDRRKTQLDWIVAKSKHQVYLLDAEQTVRPADVSAELLKELVGSAKSRQRHYPLTSQMRVRAGDDYVAFIRAMLSGIEPPPAVSRDFGEYDIRMFDSVSEMHVAVRARDRDEGLARLVAGYAWPWKSRDDANAFDIEIDDARLQWNKAQTDWIASPTAVDEVGSIHTVQGYDLNYAGVIIGNDLRYDAARGALFFDRASYFDKKGKENNRQQNKVYSDEELLPFIKNIYAVLLTRGIRGTYIYVCDPQLRAHIRRYLGLV